MNEWLFENIWEFYTCGNVVIIPNIDKNNVYMENIEKKERKIKTKNKLKKQNFVHWKYRWNQI